MVGEVTVSLHYDNSSHFKYNYETVESLTVDNQVSAYNISLVRTNGRYK